ncbi:MAG: hypothetical protein LBU37_09565 [Tannerellaceae bacterium]|jgi:hypothetical protein|nr:hypothetical protein [Tannerellaceae bacterium]
MADKKETDLIAGENCQWIRAIDSQGNSIKISVADLMKYVPGIGLAFELMALPNDGVNIIGNHDGYNSGYGWYNNAHTGDDSYAPGGSAGVFIRFKANVSPVTFFIVLDGDHDRVGQLWWRPDGGICSRVN